MALNKVESTLFEAVSGYLRERTVLGVPETPPETSHTSQFRWESLKGAFALKVADSTFYESLTSAFHAIHVYKHIDHPTFKLALSTELKSRAVPTEEINRAMKAVDGLISGLTADSPSERDAGWNPNLAEIADMTRNADNRTPKREDPFTGGGPWAESANDYAELLVVEGVIPEGDEKAANLAKHYASLKGKNWINERPRAMRLAEEATRLNYDKLAKNIGRYIDESDAKSFEKIL